MKKMLPTVALVLLACAILPLTDAHAANRRAPIKSANVSDDPAVIAAQTKRNEAQRALAAAQAKLPASSEENKAAVAAAQKALDEATAALKAARAAAMKADTATTKKK